MELKKLILNNIGAYKGYNEFTFNTNKDLNTILIGGKNGAGKTTFLNSIRLALYGPLAYGKKTVSKEYLERVSSFLNNHAKTHQNNFYIHLELIMEENFKRITIEIIRRWSITNDSVKESVDVIRDRIHLNEAEKDNFFELLRTTFPPSLLELCFFDGEEITRLIHENYLSNYLKDLSMKLFNLDLFSSLEKDLQEYLLKINKINNDGQFEAEKEKIELELKDKKLIQEKYFDTLENLKVELAEAKEKYHTIKQDFLIHGGLFYEERQKIQREISHIENERKQINEYIKEFIAKYLPFYIAYPIIEKIVVQLREEENYYLSKSLREKINELSIKDLLNEIGIEYELSLTDNFKNKLIQELTSSKNIQIIHHASKTEAHQLSNLYFEMNKNNLSKIIHSLHKNKEYLDMLNKLKRKLKDNETTTDFQEMIISMEQLNSIISNLNSKIDKYTNELDMVSTQVEYLSKKLENINEKLFRIQKTNSSYKETEKILKISRKFQGVQLRSKLKDVEYFSTIMFKELLSKKMLFDRIAIDSETFDISLLDHKNKEINIEILSAGEKEIMVLSIIWGIIKTSKKKLPFVLDTLLGRLDLEHKLSVVTKLIPKFGNQIIILATDSEIDKNLYSILKPTVSNEYTLLYNHQNKQTNIENHFFNFNIDKVVK